MKTKLFLAGILFSASFAKAQITYFYENFDDITTLTSWVQTNQSNPVGTTGWFQGKGTTFPAKSGSANSYIAADNHSTTGSTGKISNWLITPNLAMKNGDIIKFWTRTTTASPWHDRLFVWISKGNLILPISASNAGSFTSAYGQSDINPTLTVGGYPEVWTEYTLTVRDYSATPTNGNIGIVYFVQNNAGPAGSNSNYIGVDNFTVTRPELAVSDVNKTKVSVYPNPTKDYLRVNSTSKISGIEIFDISGKKVKGELLDNKVDVQNLAKGSYIIKITDASGITSQKFIKE